MTLWVGGEEEDVPRFGRIVPGEDRGRVRGIGGCLRPYT